MLGKKCPYMGDRQDTQTQNSKTNCEGRQVPDDAADVGDEAARGHDALALGLGGRFVVLAQRNRLAPPAQHRPRIPRVRNRQRAPLRLSDPIACYQKALAKFFRTQMAPSARTGQAPTGYIRNRRIGVLLGGGTVARTHLEDGDDGGAAGLDLEVRHRRALPQVRIEPQTHIPRHLWTI